jgi:hypothetical protein
MSTVDFGLAANTEPSSGTAKEPRSAILTASTEAPELHNPFSHKVADPGTSVSTDASSRSSSNDHAVQDHSALEGNEVLAYSRSEIMEAVDECDLADDEREMMYRYIVKILKQDRPSGRPRNRRCGHTSAR